MQRIRKNIRLDIDPAEWQTHEKSVANKLQGFSCTALIELLGQLNLIDYHSLGQEWSTNPRSVFGQYRTVTVDLRK